MGAEEDVVRWGTREDLQTRWQDSVCGKRKAFSGCISSHREQLTQPFFALIQHLCPWDQVMEPDSPLLRDMCCNRLLRRGSPKEGDWLRPGVREVSSTQDEWPVGREWRTSVAGVGTALSWEFSNWKGQLLGQWTL